MRDERSVISGRAGEVAAQRNPGRRWWAASTVAWLIATGLTAVMFTGGLAGWNLVAAARARPDGHATPPGPDAFGPGDRYLLASGLFLAAAIVAVSLGLRLWRWQRAANRPGAPMRGIPRSADSVDRSNKLTVVWLELSGADGRVRYQRVGWEPWLGTIRKPVPMEACRTPGPRAGHVLVVPGRGVLLPTSRTLDRPPRLLFLGDPPNPRVRRRWPTLALFVVAFVALWPIVHLPVAALITAALVHLWMWTGGSPAPGILPRLAAARRR
ncbi:hypothetical protein [Dactylosporangium sp. CS-033363]|uniref:hypothetical protein n=1 Tax=Dactylosporangium sp. CS-033363 TaxID=3239935 RepID=UPI003D908EF3